MNKREAFFLSAFMLFLGIVIGFLSSPVKHGLSIGNNSGNTYCGEDDCCCGDLDDCKDDDEDDMPF